MPIDERLLLYLIRQFRANVKVHKGKFDFEKLAFVYRALTLILHFSFGNSSSEIVVVEIKIDGKYAHTY